MKLGFSNSVIVSSFFQFQENLEFWNMNYADEAREGRQNQVYDENDVRQVQRFDIWATWHTLMHPLVSIQ
jgi:hypothetical protein